MGVAHNRLTLVRLLTFMSGVGLCCWLWRTFINMANWRGWGVKPINNSSEGKERDDFDTDYDSTWEDDNDTESEGGLNMDENTEESRGNSIQWGYWAERNEHAAKDMQKFRHMLRKVDGNTRVNIKERQKTLHNLLFYQNRKRCEPDDMLIDEFHVEWFGDYERLEYTHSYIQWLFPIQEKGVNWNSYILTEEEIKLFREDEKVKERLVKSYKLMLNFYGIKLLDEETGKVCRIKEKWKGRFENLNRNTHNNLRITRILKCLGILGLQHYQAPLVRFFLQQTLVKERLPRVKQSALNYFLFSVIDKKQRKTLIKYAFQNFQPREDFVWCPKRIQRKFLKEIKQQKSEDNDSDFSELESDDEAEGKRSNQPEKEETSFSTPVGAVQGDAGKREAGLSRNHEKDAGTGTYQRNMKSTGDDAPRQNPVSSNGNDGDKAKAMSVMSSSKDPDKMSDKQERNHEDTDEENHMIIEMGDQGNDIVTLHVDEDSKEEAMSVMKGGTGTPHPDDSKMPGQSSVVEPDEMSDNKESYHEDADKANKAVSVMPDLEDTDKESNMMIEKKGSAGAKAEGFASVLQDGTNTPNQSDSEMSAPRSAEDSYDVSEDHERKARDDTRITRHDARRPGIVPSKPDDKDNTDGLEDVKNTQSSEEVSVQMSKDQSVQESTATEDKGRAGDDGKRRDKEPPNKDDADTKDELSDTKGDTDTTQNKLAKEDDETHSQAMPVVQSGTDTTLIGDSKMPGQSSPVEPDEMSDNKENDQRLDNDPPCKDEADAMELSNTKGDTDATLIGDSKIPGQSSAVEPDEMFDNKQNGKEKEPPNKDDDEPMELS